MKRRRNYRFLLIVSFSFLFLFMSTSYALLNLDLKVFGKSKVTATSGGGMVEDNVGEEGGLQEDEDGSHFVGDGDEVHNYVKFSTDSKFWRIISIDGSGNIKIIRDQDDGLMGVWQNKKQSNRDWANTQVLKTLKSWYQENLSSYSDVIVQNPEWILNEASDKNNPSAVNTVGVYTDSPIGLIRNEEIFDSNNVDGGNEVSSWLTGDGYQWTMTYYTGNNKNAWRVNNKGKFMNSSMDSSNTYIRPVVYLKANILFASGDGSSDNPFVIS